MTKITPHLAILLVAATGATAQTTSAPVIPHTPSAVHSNVNRNALAQRVVASLVGRRIYGCGVDPGYFNGADASTGQSISDNDIFDHIRTGDELLIRKAKTDMVIDESNPKLPTVMFSLAVEDQKEDVSAEVKLAVLASRVNPEEIMMGLAYNPLFSPHPISSLPEMGMTEDEVYCIKGFPERTNSNVLDGDQLVYLGGNLLVYIGPHSLVTDVQFAY